MKTELENFLENYNSLDVPEPSGVMEQFKNKLIFIYGAGSYGTLIYHTFLKYGVKISAFLDIKSKPGDKLFEIPVYKANDKAISAGDKKGAVVVTAIVKDYKTRQRIFNFIKRCGFKTIIDAQSIRCHLVNFDDKLPADTISEHIKKQKADILKCLSLFSDEHSKKIYCKNVMAHISRNYNDCIESIGSLQYFPGDVIFDKGYSRFIDCGGYTGDTIDQLVKIKGKIKAAAVFEPNMDNFYKLSFNMDNYSSLIQELYLYPCAASNKTEIMFMDYIGGSSKLNFENKDNCVQCVAMDDTLKNFAPTFIKMDIEGAERKATVGAENIIKKFRPDLAICMYHCINHLWDIPLLINSWNLGYKFYLKTHNSFTMETVLYAISTIKDG